MIVDFYLHNLKNHTHIMFLHFLKMRLGVHPSVQIELCPHPMVSIP